MNDEIKRCSECPTTHSLIRSYGVITQRDKNEQPSVKIPQRKAKYKGHPYKKRHTEINYIKTVDKPQKPLFLQHTMVIYKFSVIFLGFSSFSGYY